jgi:hypothetical protein
MPGPPPKDPALRVRRNKVTTKATLPKAPRARRPALPRKRPAWHPLTKREWNSWWSSGAEYSEVHASGLLRLIYLVEDFNRATSAKERKEAAAEIRLQGAEFGLSPLAERRLQWERIHAEDEAAKKAKAAPPAPPPSGDPRLRLVKPSA